MTTITMKQAKQLKEKWQKELLNHKTIRTVSKKELEKDGFELCEVGTGKSAYTRSLLIQIQDVKSLNSWYLKGSHLIIGVANYGHAKGSTYRGYAIKIK